jgi:hypothetical protein
LINRFIVGLSNSQDKISSKFLVSSDGKDLIDGTALATSNPTSDGHFAIAIQYLINMLA